MTSEKRIEANRRNALKSTGPRTAEGKARSRRNALKHGLAGDGACLPPEDEQLFKERLHDWTCDARPETQMESYVLAVAVLATVRIDRLARKEQAEINRNRRRAIGRWEARQTRRVNALVALMDTEPAAAVGELATFTRGCDWLLLQWKTLIEALELPGFWTHPQGALALRLLGIKPYCLAHDEIGEAVRLNFLGAQRELDPDEADALLGTATADLDPDERRRQIEARLPEPTAAVAALRELAQGEIDFLQPLREQLWRAEDSPELSEAIDLATSDDGPDAALRHRYQSAASLEMHRALERLNKLRKELKQVAEDSRSHEPVELPTRYAWTRPSPTPPPPPAPQPPAPQPPRNEPNPEPPSDSPEPVSVEAAASVTAPQPPPDERPAPAQAAWPSVNPGPAPPSAT